jgi:hypothetical protein
MVTVVVMTMSETSGLLIFILVVIFLLFVKHSDHDCRSTIRLSDLEEWMLVAKVGLALGAVVEVLADSTFVPDADNRIDPAAVTLDTGVFNKRLLRLLGVLARLLHQLIKNAWNDLLKLLLNQILNSLARHVSGIPCTLLAFLAFLPFFRRLLNLLNISLDRHLLSFKVKCWHNRNRFDFLHKWHLKDLLLLNICWNRGRLVDSL